MANKLQRITKVRLSVVLIIIVAIALGFFDVPQVYDRAIDFANAKIQTTFPHFKNIPFRLGLDLQGGTHLVYEADTSKIPFGEKGDAVEGVRDVIERRVNAFGVAEPVVQVNKAQGKWRVIVELAGVKDVNEAIKMIGETPLLEFKEENTEPARELTPEERKAMNEFNKVAKDKANKALKEALAGKDFSEVVKTYSESETGADTGGDFGWIKQTGEFAKLFEGASKTEIGKVVPKVIDADNGLYAAKVNDKRESGQEIKASHILICFKGAESCAKETTKEEAEKTVKDLKLKITPTNFAKLAKENSTDSVAENGGELGWFQKGQMVKEFEDAGFALAKGQISEPGLTKFGYHLIYKTDERSIQELKVSAVFVKTKKESDILPPKDQWKSTQLTGKQLKNSRVNFNQSTNAPEVALQFNDEGKKLFADITSRNVGKPVAIFLDGQPISIPRVNEAITGGEAVITGNFDLAEAKQLTLRLNAGALPVPITLLSQQTVGASLGSESLQKSLFAGLIGFILVIIFMILYYRLPGFLAVVALIVYAITVLFVFKAIPVTLTLAGIAGFILSVGMAVDANVLIFERMREELRLGKPLSTSIDVGFKRAWPSIRDGNATTLITCFILAWFGTSSIKGFGITLGIGVILSMLSAIFVTRSFMQLFASDDQKRNLWWFGLKKNKDIQ